MPVKLLLGIFLFFGAWLYLAKVNSAYAGLADHLLINEIQVDSVSGTGGTDDDFVELYNPTSQPVNLSGWSIQKTSASGATSSAVKISLNGTIPANSHFLIVRDDASTTQSLKELADLKTSALSIANNNILFLVNDDIKINDANDPNIIDFVGFGTVSYYESAAAPAITETKSISRVPDGEDTDNNSIDFKVLDLPSPENSQNGADNDIGGTVLLTITPDAAPVQNISANGANVVFQVNSDGNAIIYYGTSEVYGSQTLEEPVLKNTDKIIAIAGLQCGTVYHYSIYAESIDGAEEDQSPNAIFTTLPCGITVNSLVMTKTTARANNNFADGWEWEFNLTVWNFNEASLKMKFNQWTGAGTLNAASNMQYSVDNGTTWQVISANAAYPSGGVNIGNIDNSTDAGRQIKIIVKMKVPVGTGTGFYNSGYGILTE